MPPIDFTAEKRQEETANNREAAMRSQNQNLGLCQAVQQIRKQESSEVRESLINTMYKEEVATEKASSNFKRAAAAVAQAALPPHPPTKAATATAGSSNLMTTVKVHSKKQ